MHQLEYSVGQIAKVLHVARSTVVRWIANGHLKSTKTRGGDNRISRANLISFFRKKGIPIELVDNALSKRIFVYEQDDELKNLLESVLNSEGGVLIKYAANAYDAGYMINEFKPHLVIMDVDLRNSMKVSIIDYIRGMPEFEKLQFIGTSFDQPEDECFEYGFDGFLLKPVSKINLLTTVSELLPSFRRFSTKEIT